MEIAINRLSHCASPNPAHFMGLKFPNSSQHQGHPTSFPLEVEFYIWKVSTLPGVFLNSRDFCGSEKLFEHSRTKHMDKVEFWVAN